MVGRGRGSSEWEMGRVGRVTSNSLRLLSKSSVRRRLGEKEGGSEWG